MTPGIDGFEPVLAALTAGAQQYFGDACAIVEPVARLERPFSALLRLRVTAAGRQFHAFAKVIKPRSGVPEELAWLRRSVPREYREALRLHDALRASNGMTAVRPIAVFPDEMAIVTEEVVGTTFDRLLRDALWGRRLPVALELIAERIGTWIRTYQTVIDVEGTLLLEDRRRYLEDRLQKLTAAAVLRDADRLRVLDRFDALTSQIIPQSQPLVAIHADLCPSNILISEDANVAILDFAMAKAGTRFHDLSHLYMHLEFLRWRPRLKSGVSTHIQGALLRGYGTDGAERDPLFQLMLLQHLVCHIAQLVERPSGALDPAHRWFVRRRWAKCARIPAVGLGAKPSPASTLPPRDGSPEA